MLLWVKLSSCAREAGAGAVHLGGDEVDGQLAALGDLGAAGVHRAPVDPERGSVADPVEDLRTDAVDDREPGLDEQLADPGWGSGPRSSGWR